MLCTLYSIHTSSPPTHPPIHPYKGNDIILWSEEALLLHGTQEEEEALAQVTPSHPPTHPTTHLLLPSLQKKDSPVHPSTHPPLPPIPKKTHPPTHPPNHPLQQQQAAALAVLHSTYLGITYHLFNPSSSSVSPEEEEEEDGPYQNVFTLLTPEGTVGFR